MMQMLGAGGLALLTDGARSADADNPRGYFEYEPVKATRENPSWVAAARGKAVKVVSALLMHLPTDFDYRVVFMRRPLAAILASQREMLVRRGHAPPDAATDRRLELLFERHLAEAAATIERSPSMRVFYVDYPELVAAPTTSAAAVARFLDAGLDVDGMAAAVDPSLSRQRQLGRGGRLTR